MLLTMRNGSRCIGRAGAVPYEEPRAFNGVGIHRLKPIISSIQWLVFRHISACPLTSTQFTRHSVQRCSVGSGFVIHVSRVSRTTPHSKQAT